MSKLRQNYCTNCGTTLCLGNEHVCTTCNEALLMLPYVYMHDHYYYCTYCRAKLDRYFDFNIDGTFKSEDFFCLGCSFVHEWPEGFDTSREADKKAFTYVQNHAYGVPMHVLKAWIRQNDFFITEY